MLKAKQNCYFYFKNFFFFKERVFVCNQHFGIETKRLIIIVIGICLYLPSK